MWGQAMQPDAASSDEDDGQHEEVRPTSGSSKLAYTQEQASLRAQFLQASCHSLYSFGLLHAVCVPGSCSSAGLVPSAGARLMISASMHTWPAGYWGRLACVARVCSQALSDSRCTVYLAQP